MSRQTSRGAWAGYVVALASVAAAGLLTEALYALFIRKGSIPFALFFGAVAFTSIYGGRLPGLLTILLSALVANYFFFRPFNSFSVSTDDFLQTAIFASVALIINHLVVTRKRAEQTARESEGWLSTTLTSIGDAVIATDAAGRVTFINPAAQALTGWGDEEARGRALEEVFPIINEQTGATAENPVARVIREGAVVGLANHTALVTKDGRRVPIEDSAAPIKGEGGEVTGVVLVFHDVTGRRRAEQVNAQLAALVESSDDAIIGKTLEGIITSWNAGAQRMYGYTPEETVGRHITMLVPEGRADEVAGFLEQLKRGERIDHREAVRVRKDGTRLVVSLTISPIRDGADRIVGASTIARDITAQSRAEEERERLLAREQSARAEAERAAGRTARLQAVTAALSEALTPEQVAAVIVEQALNSLGASAGATVVLDESGEELLLISTAGFLQEVVDRWRRFPVRTNVAIAETARTGEAIFLESREEWLRRFPDAGPLASASDARALATVPLSVEGRTLGAIGLSFAAPRTFDREDRDFMLAVARQCAQAVERARLYEAERRSRAEIEASEQRYRALAEAMPQIVWTARPDGYHDYYNRRWFEYTGLTLEQTQGWGWQPVLHPDDVERALRRWARSVQTGDDYEVEYRFRRASDGAYRWHLGRAQALRDAAGRVVKWFGTSTDIDDQKRTEEALRFLAEADAVLASSLDFERTLEAVARLAVPRIADYCLVDLLEEGGEIRRVVVAHSDPEKEEAWREMQRRFPLDHSADYTIPKVLRTGEPELYSDINDELLERAVKDAPQVAGQVESLKRFGIKSSMVVPLAARGRAIGTISFITAESGRRYARRDLDTASDLARRAAMAIDNAQLYRRTEEANRTKDEFLATLSHELRTPLTPIMGWVHLLRGGRVAVSELPHGLDVIERNSQALTRLINDLLDMSAIMSGKMRIEHTPVALDSVLEEAAEVARVDAARRGIRVVVEPCGGGGLDHAVSGDRTRLLQVFSNLLNNAVKFSGNGARVAVRCATEGERVRVEIEDEGRGIEPNFLPHVFERFRQADSSTTRTHGGLGLGLALVKSFVEAHGGEVSAASDGAGRGSRFTVTLPRLGARVEEAAEVPEAADAAPAEAAGEDVVRHVLIVEDARDTLEMLEAVFEARGLRTVPCATADEALGVASARGFDIIVSDIGLPQVDGYELIRRLRLMPHLRDTPAVALTGYAAQKDADAALLAGFDMHVPKPVDPNALADTIEQLLRQKSRPPEGR